MYALLRYASEPALQALARRAVSGTAACHQGACSVAARQFSTSDDAVGSSSPAGTASGASRQFACVHAAKVVTKLSPLLIKPRASARLMHGDCEKIVVENVLAMRNTFTGVIFVLPCVDVQAATPPQQQGGGGGGGAKAGNPHHFGRPYRPDIRRFVDGLAQQPQPAPPASILEADSLPAGDGGGLPPAQLDLVKQVRHCQRVSSDAAAHSVLVIALIIIVACAAFALPSAGSLRVVMDLWIPHGMRALPLDVVRPQRRRPH